ncbi:TlpA disulfide reductase family protein [Limibacter armeniacum]|uniref:TlpA family protein disulfide reductase n=1 Tax=Limibacter armeniacum TaxID=466084 RepID=UPI002FE5362D
MITTLGKEVQLKNFKGKVVLIDTWATWCGPCLNHRPRIKDFAKKYQDNSNLAILMISVDEKTNRWLDFVEKDNPTNDGFDLFIENSTHTAFGNHYNINSIPRYILIGKNGKIINSNINEPSLALEEEIDIALRN